jgi:protein phosphatase 1 regulatory subunit 21
MRAQVSVLRKAVVEEQTRNSELRDILKEREQSLRKAEQEMDSLTFRNQQLTKRVTVLQDELDLMQAGDLKSYFRNIQSLAGSYCDLDFSVWLIINLYP